MVKKLAMAMAVMMCMTTATMALAEDVYATKNGKKYHTEICRLIQNKSPHKLSMEEALKKGLTPCKLCAKDSAQENQASKSIKKENKINPLKS